MNYTKTIREFCLKNRNTLFDVSYMTADYFSMVPYKTLLRILNRLVEEKILLPVSKGVYYIQGDKPFDLEKAVKEYYVDNNHGMFVGYKMYNDLLISDHVSDTVEIYTDRIGAAHKNIGNYHLTHVNLVFDDYTKRLIQTLELIEHSPRIIDIDYMRYYNVRLNGICSYTEYEIDRVIRSIHYQHSTLVTFAELMKKAGFSVDILSKCKGA